MEESPFYLLEGPRPRPMHRYEPGVRYRGLCAPLRAAFYRHYTYKRNEEEEKQRRQHAGRRCSPTEGRQRGQQVDRDLAAYVRARTRAERQRVHARMCTYARAALAVLQARMYEPIAAQYGVGVNNYLGHDVRSSTAVDLICQVGHTNSIVAVEVKACESHYYERISVRKHTSTKMHAPYGDRDNHPRNHHQLQLGFTTRWLERTQTRWRVAGGLVLRVHAQGVQTYPLEPWVLDPQRLPAALARLARRPPKQKPTHPSPSPLSASAPLVVGERRHHT